MTTLSRVWESLLGIQNAIEEGYWFDTLFERGLGHLTIPRPPEITSVFGLQWEGSGRESLTRFIPLRLKPTGSADFSLSLSLSRHFFLSLSLSLELLEII